MAVFEQRRWALGSRFVDIGVCVMLFFGHALVLFQEEVDGGGD